MDFSELRDNVADSRYFMLSDECYSLKFQIASGGVCNEKMEKRLTNASRDVVDASVDDFNRHAAHARKVVSDSLRKKVFALAEHLQTISKQEVATLFTSVNEAACDEVTSLQGDDVHYQSTVRERLEQHDGYLVGKVILVLRVVLLLGLWIRSPGLKRMGALFYGKLI